MLLDNIINFEYLNHDQKSDLLDQIYEYQQTNSEQLSTTKYEFDQELFSPYIESNNEYYIYNFSYLPTPNFLTIMDLDIDAQAKGVFQPSQDNVISYNEYLNPITTNEISFVFDKNQSQNSLGIFSNMKDVVFLTEVIVNDETHTINEQITYGMNGIRLNFDLVGNVVLVFDKNLLNFPYIQFIKSSYSNTDIEFQLNLDGQFIIKFDSADNANSTLKINENIVSLGEYINLTIRPSDIFTLSSETIPGLKKISLLRGY